MLSLVDVSFFFFFFISLIKIMMSEKMISTLMSIELMMLSIFFFIYNHNSIWFVNSIMIVIFLSLMVCESVLGLGMYIYISRMAGNDDLKSSNMSKLL